MGSSSIKPGLEQRTSASPWPQTQGVVMVMTRRGHSKVGSFARTVTPVSLRESHWNIRMLVLPGEQMQSTICLLFAGGAGSPATVY